MRYFKSLYTVAVSFYGRFFYCAASHFILDSRDQVEAVKNSFLIRVYDLLYREYGAQGWWPIKSLSGRNGFDERGYHRGDYSYPRTPEQRFEISLGAVLTQNTSWRNVEQVIEKLLEAGLCSPEEVLKYPLTELSELIRSSGYFNQKAKKLKALSALLQRYTDQRNNPSRRELLSVWGVGPETADSILLYAYHDLYFVVDAYTRRLLIRLNKIKGSEDYEAIRTLFSTCLPDDLSLYSEYHALIVRHAKIRCRKAPMCETCPLLKEPLSGKNLCAHGNK